MLLDDPDKSSGGKNPDVIVDRHGYEWSVAVKTIHGAPSQTIFDNIKSAVRQIEKSGKLGIPFINLKNRIDQSKLLPDDMVYVTPQDATNALGALMRDIIWPLRTEIADVDWNDAFKDKLVRPLIVFMGQTLARAVVNGQDMFVPVRILSVIFPSFSGRG